MIDIAAARYSLSNRRYQLVDQLHITNSKISEYEYDIADLNNRIQQLKKNMEQYMIDKQVQTAQIEEIDNFAKLLEVKYDPSKIYPEYDKLIFELVRDNRKIEAIKAIRSATGWGLKEAKDYVEGYQQSRFNTLGDILTQAMAVRN